MAERRLERRLMCSDMVVVSWQDQAGRIRRAPGVLEDIAASGACVQLDLEIPLKTILKIRCSKGKLQGVVQYCVFRETGFFIGVELDHSSKWSDESFHPQHLLDLHTLVEQAANRGAKQPHNWVQ
jgi:hypothetical protein